MPAPSAMAAIFRQVLKPAAPVDVGLQDVHHLVADRPLEGHVGVPVLAGGQGLPGQALAQREVGVEVLGDQALFHPLEPVGAQTLGQAHGVLDVKGHPAVEHQLALVADLLPRAGPQMPRSCRMPSSPSAGP